MKATAHADPTAPLDLVSRPRVLAWMRRHVEKHRDDCGEVDPTGLAIAAAAYFGCDDLPSGHAWWDYAAEVAHAAELAP